MTDRWRYLWFALGAVLSVFAVTGRWDVALAAWAAPVLLLRFARTAGAVVAMVAIALAGFGAAVVFLWESALGLTPLTVALAAALGLLFTVPYLADRLVGRRGGPVAALLVFPLARVACEFALIAGTPLGGVFGSLGATQHAVAPLVQATAVTGSYGVSLLVCWGATVVNHVWERAGGPRRGWSRAAVVYAVVVGAVLVGGSVRLMAGAPAGRTVRVVGIVASPAVEATQGRGLAGYRDRRAIADAAPDRLRPVLAPVATDLLNGTAREAAAGARIVVWPENGARVLSGDEPALLARVADTARRYRAYVDVGLLVYTRQAPYVRDEADLVGPHGETLWTYRKAHPIPGMEPYRAGGGRVPVVSTPYGRLAGVICYDADFPAQARVRADIMLVPSHDWPAYGAAHSDKDSLRAVENGYTMVRTDSDGLSATFGPQGRVLSRVDTTEGGDAMVASVPIAGTRTVYPVVGDAFAWACLAALAALIPVSLLRRRRPSVRGGRVGAAGPPNARPRA